MYNFEQISIFKKSIWSHNFLKSIGSLKSDYYILLFKLLESTRTQWESITSTYDKFHVFHSSPIFLNFYVVFFFISEKWTLYRIGKRKKWRWFLVLFFVSKMIVCFLEDTRHAWLVPDRPLWPRSSGSRAGWLRPTSADQHQRWGSPPGPAAGLLLEGTSAVSGKQGKSTQCWLLGTLL